jgi:hypothetical protein
VPNYIDVTGRRITIVNQSGANRGACFVGGLIHSATGKSGFHCQDNPNAVSFKLLGGQQQAIYPGTVPVSFRIANLGGLPYNGGTTIGLTGYSLIAPSSPSVIEVQDQHIDIFNSAAVERDGCFLKEPGNSAAASHKKADSTSSSVQASSYLTGSRRALRGLAPLL